MIVSSIFTAAAQQGCEDCTPTTSQQSLYFPICDYNHDVWGTCYVNAVPMPDPPIPYACIVLNYHEDNAIYVRVNYTTTQCGSSIVNTVNSVTIINNMDYLETNYGPNNSYCPFDPASIATYIQQALVQLNSGGQGEYLYPRGCMSIVKVAWPAGTTIYNQPGEGGGIATTTPLIESWHAIPCDQGTCCRIVYDNNGSPVSSTGIEGACDNASMSLANYSMEITDINGNAITVTGDIIEASPCKPMCSLVPPSAFTFSTDISEINGDKKDIELSANPTLAHDFVKFSTIKPIQKIDVYNLKGQKVLSTNELNDDKLDIGSLKSGVYFIQAYFSNGVVKSIKIEKQ